VAEADAGRAIRVRGMDSRQSLNIVAQSSFQSAVKTAVVAYNRKKNPDSKSRNLALYFQMESEVTSALIVFQSALGSAGATLAAAAGTLLEAHATYMASVGQLEATLLNDNANANATFWQSVEQIRDNEVGDVRPSRRKPGGTRPPRPR